MLKLNIKYATHRHDNKVPIKKPGISVKVGYNFLKPKIMNIL